MERFYAIWLLQVWTNGKKAGSRPTTLVFVTLKGQNNWVTIMSSVQKNAVFLACQNNWVTISSSVQKMRCFTLAKKDWVTILSSVKKKMLHVGQEKLE